MKSAQGDGQTCPTAATTHEPAQKLCLLQPDVLTANTFTGNSLLMRYSPAKCSDSRSYFYAYDFILQQPFAAEGLL